MARSLAHAVTISLLSIAVVWADDNARDLWRSRPELMGVCMKEKITALLVYHRPDPLDTLRSALEIQSIQTRSVRTCGEALLLLWGRQPPHLAFTDTQLPDGNWADVIALAGKAPAPVNVIVVSRLVDVAFYLEAIERGAYDFLTPPFEPSELAHIVRCAASNVPHRGTTRESRRAAR